MADLDVQPKRPTPWWIWLLLIMVLVAAGVLFFKRDSNKSITTTSVSSAPVSGNSDGKQTIGDTEPDWSNLNPDASKSTDENITDPAISTSATNKYTIYTLGENILFAEGQSTLQSSADARLKQVAASLQKHFNGSAIRIYGNTDAEGKPDVNKELGAKRAEAVKQWLIKNGGIDSSEITVHSLGESKPVASNSTTTGRQQNRNVAIVAYAKG